MAPNKRIAAQRYKKAKLNKANSEDSKTELEESTPASEEANYESNNNAHPNESNSMELEKTTVANKHTLKDDHVGMKLLESNYNNTASETKNELLIHNTSMEQEHNARKHMKRKARSSNSNSNSSSSTQAADSESHHQYKHLEEFYVCVFNCKAGAHIRDVRSFGVKSLKESYIKEGYNLVDAAPIAVYKATVPPLEMKREDSDESKLAIEYVKTHWNIEDQRIRFGSYQVIDGMHRIQAIRELSESKPLEHFFVKARLYVGLDDSQIVELAGKLNHIAQAHVKTTLLDKFAHCTRLRELAIAKGNSSRTITMDQIKRCVGDNLLGLFNSNSAGQYYTSYTGFYLRLTQESKDLLQESEDDTPFFSENLFLKNNAVWKNVPADNIHYVLLRLKEMFEVKNKGLRTVEIDVATAVIDQVSRAQQQYNLIINEIDQRTRAKRTSAQSIVLRKLQHRVVVQGLFDVKLEQCKNNSPNSILPEILKELDKSFPRPTSTISSKRKRDNGSEAAIINDSNETESSQFETAESEEEEKEVLVMVSDDRSSFIGDSEAPELLEEEDKFGEKETVLSEETEEAKERVAEEKRKAEEEQEEKELQIAVYAKLQSEFEKVVKVINMDCCDWCTSDEAKQYEKKINLVLTDCPYNVLKSSKNKLRPDDEISDANMKEFVANFTSRKLLVNGGSLLIMCHWRQLVQWADIGKAYNLLVNTPVVLIKKPCYINAAKRSSCLHTVTSFCMFLHDGDNYYRDLEKDSEVAKDPLISGAYNRSNNRSCFPAYTNVIANITPTQKHEWVRKSGDIKQDIGSEEDEEVDEESNNNQKEKLPARWREQQKSEDYWRIFIKAYCPEEGTVFDPYGGTGSCGIACLRYNRKYIMTEIDEACAKAAKVRLFQEFEKLHGAEVEESIRKPRAKLNSHVTLHGCKCCGITSDIYEFTEFYNEDFCSENCFKSIETVLSMGNKGIKHRDSTIPAFIYPFVLPGTAIGLAGSEHFKNFNSFQALYEQLAFAEPVPGSSGQTCSFSKEQMAAAREAEAKHWGGYVKVEYNETIQGYTVVAIKPIKNRQAILPIYGPIMTGERSKQIRIAQKNYNESAHNELIQERSFNMEEHGPNWALEMHDLSAAGCINSTHNPDGTTNKANVHAFKFSHQKYDLWYNERKLPVCTPYIMKAIGDIKVGEELRFPYDYMHFPTKSMIVARKGQTAFDSDCEEDVEQDGSDYEEGKRHVNKNYSSTIGNPNFSNNSA